MIDLAANSRAPPVVALFLLLPLSMAYAFTVKSDEGHFTAELPAPPVFKKVAVGPVVRYRWIAGQSDRIWFVSYNDYPAGMIASTGLEEVYEGGISEVVRDTKGVLHSFFAFRVIKLTFYVDETRRGPVIGTSQAQTPAG